MIEAKYYTKGDEKNVTCILCPIECQLKEDESGQCKVRTNINGKLYSTIYKKVTTMQVERVEKSSLFHFHPGSNVFAIGAYESNLTNQLLEVDRRAQQTYGETVSIESIIELAKTYDCDVISISKSEPIIWYDFTLALAKAAKIAGLKIVIVTNGFVKPEPFKELLTYVDAVSLSLKGFSDEAYKEITGSNAFETVKNSIKLVKAAKGVHLELSTDLIKNINNNADDIKHTAKWIIENLGINVPWHIYSFYPCKDVRHLSSTSTSDIETAVNAAKTEGMQYVYAGNLIYNEFESTLCPKCSEILIHRVDDDVINKSYVDEKCPSCQFEFAVIDG
jgi:pyruvate formate lyase activating enzyme